MDERAILLTIKRIFAEQILGECKSTEYRRRPPKITTPTRTVLYVSGIKQIIGECTMDPVCGDRTSLGYPLPVYNPIRYVTPLAWTSIHQTIAGIQRPHRSFRYLKPENHADSKLLELLDQHR